MNTNSCFQHNLYRTLSHALVVGLLSSAGLLGGLIPELSESRAIIFSSSAYAQVVSDAEVSAFAQIVWELEPTRRRLIGEIEKVIGSKDFSDILCRTPQAQSNSLSRLPNNARPLARQLCNEYERILGRYRMSIDRFETIVSLVKGKSPADPDLKRRVDQKLIQIQQGKASK